MNTFPFQFIYQTPTNILYFKKSIYINIYVYCIHRKSTLQYIDNIIYYTYSWWKIDRIIFWSISFVLLVQNFNQKWEIRTMMRISKRRGSWISLNNTMENNIYMYINSLFDLYLNLTVKYKYMKKFSLCGNCVKCKFFLNRKNFQI